MLLLNFTRFCSVFVSWVTPIKSSEQLIVIIEVFFIRDGKRERESRHCVILDKNRLSINVLLPGEVENLGVQDLKRILNHVIQI